MTLDEYTIEDGGSTNLAGKISSIMSELDGIAETTRKLFITGEENDNV